MDITKGEKPMRHILNAGIAFLSLSLVGCNLHTPTDITDQRVQVHEEMFTEDMLLADVDDAYLGALARHYTKHGGSTMDLIVTYDPKSYRNTAMTATNKISDISETLRDYGVTDVNAGIMPIKSQGDDAHMVVSYSALTAHAPEGCVSMSGTDGQPLGYNEDYKLGCSIKTMVARQVSKPAHLLGRGNVDSTTDGRSSTNIVDLYRNGAQNPPLDGESATE